MLRLDLLGSRLRLSRLGRGWSLSRAAGEAGVSSAWLSMVERGRYLPDLRLLVRLSELYGVSVFGLLEGRVEVG